MSDAAEGLSQTYLTLRVNDVSSIPAEPDPALLHHHRWGFWTSLRELWAGAGRSSTPLRSETSGPTTRRRRSGSPGPCSRPWRRWSSWSSSSSGSRRSRLATSRMRCSPTSASCPGSTSPLPCRRVRTPFWPTRPSSLRCTFRGSASRSPSCWRLRSTRSWPARCWCCSSSSTTSRRTSSPCGCPFSFSSRSRSPPEWSWAPRALLVHVRDLVQVLPVVVSLGLFATPVIWPFSKLPVDVQAVYSFFNPLGPVIDNIRRTVLLGMPPAWGLLGIVSAGALCYLIGGYSLFKRLESDVADIA